MSKPPAALPSAPPGLSFEVSLAQRQTHLFNVRLRIERPAAKQLLSLPVWIPGSYLVREFAQHLQGLQAEQGGVALKPRQLNKHQWQVPADPAQPLLLSYQVYAFDPSVRAAYLDGERAFFNGTSLCLQVHGQTEQAHGIRVLAEGLPPTWRLATGLTAQQVDARGFGSYRAQHYTELVDSPVEMGHFWDGSFEVRGVPHRFIVSGASAFMDGPRLLADTERICRAQIDFWHPDPNERPPFEHYLFMLNATADGYGGLEHHNSTALICQRADLPRVSADHGPAPALKASDGYTTLLGLISHEYFHTWNVKRLRPWELAEPDLGRENHTELLWFFEGFTSYYDDLFLRRCGLIDEATYLQLLGKTINQVQQTPGRLVQTVAQASFDAWTKYYRQSENTANATVSYYTKGALVALCLDLSLRNQGHSGLDEVMRGLWLRCAGGPMKQGDLEQVLKQLSGRPWTAQLSQWVHSTEELPLAQLLPGAGVMVRHEAAPLAQQLGLRVAEGPSGLSIKTVLRGGAAEDAGMAAGDLWVALELAPSPRGQVGQGGQGGHGAHGPELWHIHKLDEVHMLVGQLAQVGVWVARNKRLLRLQLHWPQPCQTWRLSVADAHRTAHWLGPQAPAPTSGD